MTLLSAKGLTKRFGQFTAVDHVGFDVKRGEVVGFIGPNGAGKSTTMKMVAGFLEPDEGTATICDYDVQGSPLEAKRHLGYLPEGAPAYSDMTVAEFLTFIGKMHGLRKGRLSDRLAEMVERVSLGEVWNRRIEGLSKGFKRRVGIAQALVHDPDVLIMDEPTDGLDPNQKHQMRSLISGIAGTKAIVVSTHLLEEVEAICNRTVIVADGKVIADETPQQLLSRSTAPLAIELTLVSPEPDRVIATLEPFANGSRIELVGQVNGATRVLVHDDGGGLEPARLASEIAGTDLKIEDIGLRRPRLEDVFREIAGGRPN